MPSGIRLTNLREFQDTLKRKMVIASHRTHAQIANKACLTVLLGSSTGPGAVKTTRAAKQSRIRQDLGRRYHGWTFKGKSHAVKLLFLIASKWMVKGGVKFESWRQWNAEVAIRALRIASARARSANFLQAGWLQAAHQLQGKMGIYVGSSNAVGARRGVLATGRASRGRAVTATPYSLRAIAYNNAVERKRGGGDDPASYAIAEEGLNMAIANATKDIEVYVVRKELEKVLKDFSDRKY